MPTLRKTAGRQRAYSSWINMRNQGSRAIGVEKIPWPRKWDTFEGFFEDMGARPKHHVLTRKNSLLPFSKRNCAWGDKGAAFTGRAWNNMITWRGRTLSVFEWARELNINKQTLVTRMRRGWTAEEAFLIPPGERRS
jgi:hypothetical protein